LNGERRVPLSLQDMDELPQVIIPEEAALFRKTRWIGSGKKRCKTGL
jgi:hypothetical protein